MVDALKHYSTECNMNEGVIEHKKHKKHKGTGEDYSGAKYLPTLPFTPGPLLEPCGNNRRYPLE